MISRISYIVHTAVLLASLVTTGYAQDLKTDIVQMSSYYKNVDRVGFGTKVNIYNKEGGKVATQQMELKRNGDNFVYQVEQTEMLVTREHVLMVNNAEKNITLRSIDAREWEAIHNNTYKINVDSVIGKYDSVKFEFTTAGLKHYTIYSSKNLIRKTDLWLDAGTGMISKMIYLYNEKLYKGIAKVELLFTVLPDDFLNDKKLFSEERILLKQGNDYKTAPQYSTYKLNIVNNGNQE